MTQPLQPLVTVIIPFLNEERFLKEAVESVRQQTYTNWEIILVDDGSSDNSTSIAKTYAAQYVDKIRYAEHENHANKGLSTSRNLAISLAKGDIIALLDADDVWLPGKLQAQIDILQANPDVAMILEASEYWYSWHDAKKKDVVIPVGKKQDKCFLPPTLIEDLYPLSDGAAPCPSGIMIRKAITVKHGGFEASFTGKYQLYEDQAFLHKIYLNEPVFVSSLCNNRYRQREGSLVQKITHEGYYHNVRQHFLEWLEQYIKQHQIQQPVVQRLLKKALEPYRHPYLHAFKKTVSRINKAVGRH